MALKTFRPLTPSLRFTALQDLGEITKHTPEKSLLEPKKRTGGRNSYGRVTMRRVGGGHKKHYRKIDWKRSRADVAEVIGIEYDPNRTARIALLKYADGAMTYIVAPVGLRVGAKLQAGANAAPEIGNTLPLNKIPAGSFIHNIELIPGRGAQMVRSAGSVATLMGMAGEYAQIKLASGEIRLVHGSCIATLGQVGNVQHENVSLGKAGRNRWLGRRPRVRGMTMNPVDHPNGGGQGKSKGGGGRQHLRSPWGQLSKGYKTRKKHKTTNKFILERKKKK
ncbi:MAG: 50S ribosomal protein L2 [Verrucomicrobiales bacterium]|jgi:large subunit ribosomal protein L2|nr:50S ribosomal protein L2 [Verrucomicrobiales bacterium]